MTKYNELYEDQVEYIEHTIAYVDTVLEQLRATRSTLRAIEERLINDRAYANYVHDRHKEDIEAVTDPEGEYLADQWQEELEEPERLDMSINIDDIPF